MPGHYFFPQVSVFISIHAETSCCFVYEFDGEMLKEVEVIHQAVLVDDFGGNRVRFTALNINRSADTR